MIEFDVYGTPAPKGSNRAMVRGGRAVFVPGGSAANQNALKSWDACVREAVRIALSSIPAAEYGVPILVGVPIAVSIVFRMARPGGHWTKKGGLKPSAPAFPAVKPDVDKLARATCDSLNGSLFDDDARIVRLTVTKEYAEPGREGATIQVSEYKR